MKTKSTALFDCWVMGAVARCNREPITTCPHPRDSVPALAWVNGYRAWERETRPNNRKEGRGRG